MTPRLAILSLLLAWAPKLGAQVSGVVRDPGGSPIPDAVVELWAPTKRLDLVATSSTGRFAFPPDSGAAGLWVRRIGYRPQRTELSSPSAELALTLEPLALKQPELSVSARPICPGPDEPAARRAILAMAQHYSQATDTLGLETYAWEVRGRVSTPGLTEFDTTDLTLGLLGSAGLARRYLRRQIEAYGYALPANGGFGEATGLWEYVPLARTFPQHFVDSLFPQLHRFRFLATTGPGSEIAFCPVSQRLPSIEGVLEVSAIGTLQRVTWRYRVPKSPEEAGGEVMLTPVVPTAAPALLLSVTSLYWRRISPSTVYQAWERYIQWKVGSTDAIPGH